ncbi:MAG: hydratase [Oscillospiraceae bacterium]|jgi:aconitate hydratase|nr:hydratase [Oscillospiraceae bacterium]
MIKYSGVPVTLDGGKPEIGRVGDRNATMAYQILNTHNQSGTPEKIRIKFDALMSHDITYVSIIQTARAGGMTKFPMPYVLTNCHNSLCAVGGTINADDHAFGLSAAKKYGGTYVAPNEAVCHQYVRENLAAPGKMILGSDSHTRYGAYGTLGIGEGGGELVKQLLGDTYDADAPEVVLIWVTGEVPYGVGPHDIAISMCGELFPDGRVKNKILEFAGPGVDNLTMDFKTGIDVMTTETTCLSSIWAAGELKPKANAGYDAFVELDLSTQECMLALPFHPSNAVTIREFSANPDKYLAPLGLTDKIINGKVYADQGIIVGCSGGLAESLTEAAELLPDNGGVTPDFDFSVYPASVNIQLELMRSGVLEKYIRYGAIVKPAFCGPCFGAGDTPPHRGLSVRHATRNFPNREGSRPADGQECFVALMDARSIAATAVNGGAITAASDAAAGGVHPTRGGAELKLAPNITDWPEFPALPDNLTIEICASIDDAVTTTDELIPSGETSSYRSNPIKLADFTLSRRCPDYVRLAKSVRDNGQPDMFSAIFARKPGDGSAREQAASCQRVLGGAANIAYEYATKRYRSNLINWGVVPFTVDPDDDILFPVGTVVYIPDIRKLIAAGARDIPAFIKECGLMRPITLRLREMTADECRILLAGCLMNDYKNGKNLRVSLAENDS